MVVMWPGRGEADPSLRRVERDATRMTIACAAAALVIRGGRPDGALGVLAGAGLMAFSYAAIKGGVTAIASRAAEAGDGGPGSRVGTGRLAWLAARFIGRYLVIGLAAWFVLVRFQAHPIGLFVGVTVPIAAIGLEAFRLFRGSSRRGGGPVP
jgi:hypothetical protein